MLFDNLPNCNQTWAHSIVSEKQLEKTLDRDGSISAIETDILMGTVVGDNNNGDDNDNVILPITAHPPNTTSDLSVKAFLERLVDTHHHIKLDIKSQNAVLPTVLLVREIFSRNNNDENRPPTNVKDHRTLFLNADILPGPGRSEYDMSVNAHDFLRESKHELFTEDVRVSLSVVFSLGWKVDVCWPFGYTAKHLQQMNQLLEIHQLTTAPIVLAVNARLLVKSNPQVFFDFLLSAHRQKRQLLVWSGVGEPPIGMYTLAKLVQTFQHVSDQVGFDVQIADHWIQAVRHDVVVYVLGWENLILRLMKYLVRFFIPGIKRQKQE